MSEQQPQPDENRHERAEVARLIAERHREAAEEHRNTREDMRQVAEELRDSAETQREAVAQKWHESASEGRHADREALGQLKEHVYRLEGRVSRLESLLQGATEQILSLVQELSPRMTDEGDRAFMQRAMANAQIMAEAARQMRWDAQKVRENIPPSTQ